MARDIFSILLSVLLISAPGMQGCKRASSYSSPNSFGVSKGEYEFVHGVERLQEVIDGLKDSTRLWLECMNWQNLTIEYKGGCTPTSFDPNDEVTYLRHYLHNLLVAKAILTSKKTKKYIKNNGRLDEVESDISAVVEALEPAIQEFEKEYLTDFFGETPFETHAEYLLSDPDELYAEYRSNVSALERSEELELQILLLAKLRPEIMDFDGDDKSVQAFIPAFINKFFIGEMYACIMWDLERAFASYNHTPPEKVVEPDKLLCSENTLSLSKAGEQVELLFKELVIASLEEQGHQDRADLLKDALTSANQPKDIRKKIEKIIEEAPEGEELADFIYHDIPATVAEVPMAMKQMPPAKMGQIFQALWQIIYKRPKKSLINGLRSLSSRYSFKSKSLPSRLPVDQGGKSVVDGSPNGAVRKSVSAEGRNSKPPAPVKPSPGSQQKFAWSPAVLGAVVSLLGIVMTGLATASADGPFDHEANLGAAMGVFITLSRADSVLALGKEFINLGVINRVLKPIAEFSGTVVNASTTMTAAQAKLQNGRFAMSALFKKVANYRFLRIFDSQQTLSSLANRIITPFTSSKWVAAGGVSNSLGAIAGMLGGIMFAMSAKEATSEISLAVRIGLSIFEFSVAGLGVAATIMTIPGINVVFLVAGVVALVFALLDAFLFHKSPKEIFLTSQVHPHKNYFGSLSYHHFGLNGKCVVRPNKNRPDVLPTELPQQQYLSIRQKIRFCPNQLAVTYLVQTAQWKTRNDQCLQAGRSEVGGVVSLKQCDKDEPLQRWKNFWSQERYNLTIGLLTDEDLKISNGMLLGSSALKFGMQRYPKSLLEYDVAEQMQGDVSLFTSLSFSDAIGEAAGGDGFSYSDKLTKKSRLTEITVFAGSRIDKLKVSYNENLTLEYGGAGGKPHKLSIAESDYLHSVKACLCRKPTRSLRVCALRFGVKDRHSDQPSQYFKINPGGLDSKCDQIIAPEDSEIIGFFGRSGRELDQIGALFKLRD